MNTRSAPIGKPTSRAGTQPTIRCAIYTRKSSEEGLEQEFNSLDAQRESAEAYIASQKNEGWVCLPEHYDDGGYTGGNMDRPAMQRLLVDIAANKVDCVVVYKVDRLSRSLLDFGRVMETFDQHKVAFVSVTQQFNTTHSMGRLTLNILLSFAQFEREIISERTRDKIAATRRKGKWSGGPPILGYDVEVSSGGPHLMVNADEAPRVRQIFDLLLKHETLLATVEQLDQRGWVNKVWTTRKGITRGGRPFDRQTLYKLLTNVIYAGKLKYKEEVHEGEHEAIVPVEVWEQVQARLTRNRRGGGAEFRNKYGALLRGILRCRSCGCAMCHTYTIKGTRRYRYYTCLNAQKRGWHKCPSKSLPAGEIEQFVIDQIRDIGKDPTVVAHTLVAARQQAEQQIANLTSEQAALERELKRHCAELKKVAGESHPSTAHLADLNERVQIAEHRLLEISQRIERLNGELISEAEVKEALARFDPLWETMTQKERVRLVQLLIRQVEYDGERGIASVTFHPTGIKALAQQAGDNYEGAAA